MVLVLIAAALLAVSPVADPHAGATVMPVPTVVPDTRPVGCIVTVTFGPAGNDCGSPGFESAAGVAGGRQSLPFIGDHGAQASVIPRAFSTPSPATDAPVVPGDYRFVLTCDTSTGPPPPSPSPHLSPSLPPTARGRRDRPTADGHGYWEVAADGGIFSFGALFLGSAA